VVSVRERKVVKQKEVRVVAVDIQWNWA